MRTDGNVDHLWLRVADLAASVRFYEAIAAPAGIRKVRDTPERATFEPAPIEHTGGTFSLLPGEPPTRDLHIAFPAPDGETVRAFHAAAIGAGYVSNGEPGERPEYHPGSYGAFAWDPDGTNVEVVDHNRPT